MKEQKLELIYSYTLSFTSEIEGVGGQCHAPATLPPKSPSTSGWVGLCVGLDGYEKCRLFPQLRFKPLREPQMSD